MAESTQSDRTVAADPAVVLDIIADFPSYPEWIGQVKRATVLSEDADGWPVEVEFVMDAGVLRDTYTLGYQWDIQEDGTGTITWHLVESSILKALDGVYELTAVDEGTHVVYGLTVDTAMPMIGALRRKAERVIIDAALKGLKQRAENA